MAQSKSSVAIFVIPDLSDEKKEVIIEKAKKEDKNKSNEDVTIQVPVKNDEGGYDLIDISYSQEDDKNTITIPGSGEYSIIENEDGSYNFQLTPEQIDGSSNVTCEVKNKKKGTCTIEPFVTMVGGKIVSSEKLTFDYTQGKNLNIATGQASDLKITSKDSETNFTTAETDAGDTTFQVSIGKESNNKTKFGPDIPKSFNDSKNVAITLGTSKLTHTVTNPSDPNDSRVKFAVKDGGVASHITFKNDEQMNLNIGAATTSGITYNSDPYSDNSLIVDTTSAMGANFSLDESRASLSLAIAPVDNNGKKSQVSIIDKRDPNQTTEISSTGQTFLNVSQGVVVDKENNKVDPYGAVNFEVGSESLEVKSTSKDGKTNTTSLTGLYAVGVYDKSKKEGNALLRADNVSATTSGGQKISANDLRLAMQEDDKSAKYQAMSSHAYFSNGEVELELNDIAAMHTSSKDEASAEKFNGRSIKEDTIAIGNNATIKNSDSEASVDGGVVIRNMKFYDGGQISTASGQKGSIKTGDYKVDINEGFGAVNETDKNGKVLYQEIAINKASISGSGHHAQVESSTTSKQFLGTNEEGSIYRFDHSSNGIKYSGNGLDLSNDSINTSVVDAGSIKYGEVDAKTIKAQQGNKNFQIESANVVFYNDKKEGVTSAQAELGKIQAQEVNYSVNIIAKDENGVEGKFKIFFFDDGVNQSYKVFAEDGSRVELSGSDKDNRHAKALFESIEYFQNDNFKSFLASNVNGELSEVKGDSGELAEFNVARIEGVESIDGKYKYFELSDGRLKLTSIGTGEVANISAENALYIKNGNTSAASVSNGHINYVNSDINANGNFSNLNFASQGATSAAQITGGNISATHSSGTKFDLGDSNISVYNNSDTGVTIAQGDLGKTSVTNDDFVVNITAKDANGNEGQYSIQIYDDGINKNYNIYAKDGSRVELDGKDKNNVHANVLLDSVNYFQNEDFRSVLAKNIDGQVTGFNPESNALANFNIASISSIESLDGKYKLVSAADGKINYIDKSNDASLAFSKADLAQITNTKGETTTLFQGKDLDVVAINYDSMVKASGQAGNISLIDSQNLKSIQVDDLNNVNIQDLNSQISASINADKIVAIQSKDQTYLLVDKSVIKAEDPTNGIKANINVGVLEFLQDKDSGSNIILNADLRGRVNIDKTKSPVAAEASFALKGKNMVAGSQSRVSNDGKTVSHYFEIGTVDGPNGNKGRIDNVEFKAGPSFLKDAISFEAKGSENGGKKLSFSFQQDKENGTYFVRAEFIEGDKVKVKLFPFTLESKKEGDDAVAELMVTPKGQNYMNHLEIISSVVSANEITSWLDISNGGMIIARTPNLAGVGIEMMYQDQDFFDPGYHLGLGGSRDKAKTFGAGLFYESDKGDRTSVGLMLSGDSEYSYQTNGRGVLKVFGVDMAKNGRIPGTVNLYLKKDYADGDSFYGGLSVDTTSYAIDQEALRSDAAYYNGGRSPGRLGASFAYSKKISDNSRLSLSFGANNDFKDPAFCISYTATFGGGKSRKKIKRLASDTMKIINHMPEYRPKPPINFDGPTIKGAVDELNFEIAQLETHYKDAKNIEKIRNALKRALFDIENSEVDEQTINFISDIRNHEIKSIRDPRLADDVRAILGPVLVARSTASVYDKKNLIKYSMEKLAKQFEQTGSSELLEEYESKIRELNDIKG